MSSVQQIIADAFRNNTKVSRGNTTVTTREGRTEMLLHGHLIAYKDGGKLFITNCGYQTNVTKDRLTTIDGVVIRSVKGEWFLNGVKWDGKLIEVK